MQIVVEESSTTAVYDAVETRIYFSTGKVFLAVVMVACLEALNFVEIGAISVSRTSRFLLENKEKV